MQGVLARSRLELAQEVRRLVQRQTHYAGIAADDLRNECGRAALDRVGPGFVVRLPGLDIFADLGLRELTKAHRVLVENHVETVFIFERHSSKYTMLPARELLQHGGRLRAIRRFAEDGVAEAYRRVRGEHREPRQAALDDPQPARLGFLARDPLDVDVRRLAFLRRLVEVAP